MGAIAEMTSSSSSESDSEEGQVERPTPKMIKPTYVAKKDRSELKAFEAQLEEQRLKEQQEEELLKEKQATLTHEMVNKLLSEEAAKEAKRKELLEKGLISSLDNEDTDEAFELPSDEIKQTDMDAELSAWEFRELARLRRDWLKEHEVDLVAEETEKRRKLSESELLEENERLRQERLAKAGVQKGRMNFMQKYYHKGAFFQNVMESGEEEAFKKNFNAPIPEESIDLTLLPKAMQVRRGEFGKRSRSKYTHLTDQDTSDKTSGWSKSKRNER